MSYLIYQEKYQEFINTYRTGITGADVIGEIVMRLSSYFAECNIHHAELKTIEAKKACDIECATDPATGKQYTSAKARTISEASDEAADERMAAAHLENINTHLQSLKCLQRGTLNEYSHNSA